MSNYKLQPLTEEEIAFAEKYHDCIYYFLRKRGYDIEEYYDIAVMGYLKAVQKYCRDDELKSKWAFPTICNHDMWREIGHEAKKSCTQKRMPEGGFVSLDYQDENSSETLINSILTPTLEDDFFAEYDRLEEADRIKKLIKNLFPQLTDIQKRIILLKANGMTNKSIAEKMQIPFQKINWELKRIKNMIFPNNVKKTKINANTRDKYLIKCLGAPVEIIMCLSLSPRQKEVFDILIKGYKQVDVARSLNISKNAVNEAVRQIRKKAEKVK